MPQTGSRLPVLVPGNLKHEQRDKTMSYQKSEKPKTTIYHSELVKLCKEGAIHCEIKTEVMASTFKGKPPYCVLIINGVDRTYSMENDNCQRALSNRKGQKVMLEATGREAEAQIKILGATMTPQQQENSSPATQSDRQVDNPSRQQNEPPENRERKYDSVDRTIALRKFYGARGNAIVLAATESVRVVEQFCQMMDMPFGATERQMTLESIAQELTKTTFTSLFIAADRGRNPARGEVHMLDEFSCGKLAPLVEAAKKRLEAQKSH